MSTWIYVRSTVNMAGMRRDWEVWIDADLEQFGPLLEARYLIPVDPPWWEIHPDEQLAPAPDGIDS